MKEREERKKNIIIKGLEVREGKRREAVKELLRKVGVDVEIEEIRRVGGGIKDRREMVLVKIAKEEQKKEVMRKKGSLKERRENM